MAQRENLCKNFFFDIYGLVNLDPSELVVESFQRHGAALAQRLDFFVEERFILNCGICLDVYGLVVTVDARRPCELERDYGDWLMPRIGGYSIGFRYALPEERPLFLAQCATKPFHTQIIM